MSYIIIITKCSTYVKMGQVWMQRAEVVQFYHCSSVNIFPNRHFRTFCPCKCVLFGNRIIDSDKQFNYIASINGLVLFGYMHIFSSIVVYWSLVYAIRTPNFDKFDKVMFEEYETKDVKLREMPTIQI